MCLSKLQMKVQCSEYLVHSFDQENCVHDSVVLWFYVGSRRFTKKNKSQNLSELRNKNSESCSRQVQFTCLPNVQFTCLPSVQLTCLPSLDFFQVLKLFSGNQIKIPTVTNSTKILFARNPLRSIQNSSNPTTIIIVDHVGHSNAIEFQKSLVERFDII